ncbi:hypothetical protein JCM5353_001706 [Sporobolomyces roseus]
MQCHTLRHAPPSSSALRQTRQPSSINTQASSPLSAIRPTSITIRHPPSSSRLLTLSFSIKLLSHAIHYDRIFILSTITKFSEGYVAGQKVLLEVLRFSRTKPASSSGNVETVLPRAVLSRSISSLSEYAGMPPEKAKDSDTSLATEESAREGEYSSYWFDDGTQTLTYSEIPKTPAVPLVAAFLKTSDFSTPTLKYRASFHPIATAHASRSQIGMTQVISWVEEMPSPKVLLINLILLDSLLIRQRQATKTR